MAICKSFTKACMNISLSYTLSCCHDCLLFCFVVWQLSILCNLIRLTCVLLVTFYFILKSIFILNCTFVLLGPHLCSISRLPSSVYEPMFPSQLAKSFHRLCSAACVCSFFLPFIVVFSCVTSGLFHAFCL